MSTGSLSRWRGHFHQGRRGGGSRRSRDGDPTGDGRDGDPDSPALADGRAFYVLEGSGNVVLDDVRHAFERGASMFIPQNTWHGFENPRDELPLLWIVSPAGLDGFFRETCSPPRAPAKALSRDQIREIARRYDTEFR